MSLFKSLGPLALVLAATHVCLAAAPAPRAAAVQTKTVTLKEGDPAPAFTPGAWVKGEPVKALAPGKIYVMEFWATWCGPCKAAIPHLTALARQYAGKVTIIGVNVMETGKPEEVDRKVKAFVDGKGAEMDYLVCRDTPDGAMATKWLKAAGKEGIPATFIVDGKGRIVWTGHPMALDPILQKVVAGTFDPAAEAAATEENKKVEGEIAKAAQAQEWQRVLDLLPGFKPINPIATAWAGFYRFQAQLHLDPKVAEAQLAKVRKDQPELLITYLGMITGTDGLAASWYEMAVADLKGMVEQNKAFYGMLAKAQAKAGDFKGAARSKAEDLKQLRARVPEILKDHPEAGPMIKEQLAKDEALLKDYEAKAAKRP
ncbi:TlpA disulfide reductase family protein [Mesoterricola sediminis]|uniref:Thioredoxin domain-containing protein n=1 Tax=Mesoterricola sediminis TaxID=2927980 RepID=A0AA48GUU0_9BACT|nr:TlpA disulfide reductase family protein [Mesoterricola sediminis]BDU78189.1 hypothetical protein METESE_31470 [Mesoterricola sediminis]